VESGTAAEVLDHPQRPETQLFVATAQKGAEAIEECGVVLQDDDAEECLPRRIELIDESPTSTKKS
jgi:hypothetical protein